MYRLLILVLLLSSIIVRGGEYNKIVVPKRLQDLQDSTIKSEIISIIQDSVNTTYLHSYKTKGNEKFFIANYPPNDNRFYVSFTDSVKRKGFRKRETVNIYNTVGKPLLNIISFYHVKYIFRLTPYSLSNINKEVLSVFNGQQLTVTTKAYSTSNRLRHYLYLSFESNGKKVGLIFIISRSVLYECIVV